MNPESNRVTGKLVGLFLAGTLMTGTATAGALFQYEGISDRAADVFGFVQFNAGIAGTPGDSWTIDDVDSFSLSIGGTTYASPAFPGVLVDGPGIFGAENPFANFPETLLFFQNAGGQIGSGTTIIELTGLSSSLVLFPVGTSVAQYIDTTGIRWSRSTPPVAAAEPAPLWLLLAGLLLVTAGNRARRPSSRE